MHLLSWNIRGLGSEVKRRKIRKVLKDEKVDMVFFQETKREVINSDMDSCCSRNFIVVTGKVKSGFDGVLVNLYAPNECWGLPRTVSDHCPIVLKEDNRDWGPKPFRFMNCWVLHSDFLPMAEKLRLAEEEFHQLDLIAESRELSVGESSRRAELKELIWKLSKRAEWFWLQKSRQDWALRGDKNTRFFHLIAKCRQNINLINSVVVNGVVVDDPATVKLEVWNHFKSAFSESWKVRPRIGGVFQTLAGSQASDLEREFSEAEVWNALRACDGNKAPGPDGFNLLAIRKCWNFMKGGIILFFNEFYAYGKLASGLISSFIALIPKCDNPCSLNEYRPISLIGSMYKILAKVLSNRLKSAIPSIISPTQSAFLGERFILDGVLVANEVLDWWRCKKKRGVIIKIDFEKAYDCVNWSFLLNMMESFEFGHKWRSWIHSYVTNARISVLVNGSPTNEFIVERVLRQGDPLSPFLFNLVVKGLNILILRARELGLFNGAVVGNDLVKVSHLQFADDTILFCEANLEEILCIKRLLRCFEVVSGLKINYSKNMAIGVGVDEVSLDQYAAILNCSKGVLPISFLGLPLGLPEGVAKELDRIQASFLWAGSDLKKKVHLVKWSEVTKELRDGGLGIRRIRDVNLCLLAKWWWRFGCVEKALWKEIICGKYKFDPKSWLPSTNSQISGSRVWSDILSAVDKEASVSVILSKRSSPNGWVFNFRRRLYSWESVDLSNLILLLNSGPVLRSGVEDKLVWTFGASERGRLKTSVLLQNIGALDPSGPSLCCFCNSCAEDVCHVLLYCQFAWQIWSDLVKWWSLVWVMPDNVSQLLDWWSGFKFKKVLQSMWDALPSVVMWFVWKARNEIRCAGSGANWCEVWGFELWLCYCCLVGASAVAVLVCWVLLLLFCGILWGDLLLVTALLSCFAAAVLCCWCVALCCYCVGWDVAVGMRSGDFSVSFSCSLLQLFLVP
ncbi:uncharacterized protein LOC114283731 [Camellia sinensis]|uniref:uncharacterized protein LOC114283731 n=1 Tax=Camellia sinensis TaxID=4442 RepID=UPI0010362250|nr:uncharacterized protein LOC114283731 [Camellia sinensis]